MINKIKLGLLYFWVFLQIISAVVVFSSVMQGQLAEAYDFLTNTGLVGYIASFLILIGILEIAVPKLNKKLFS